MGKKAMEEIAKAVPKTASARGRGAGRERSAIMELEGATPQASPAPIRKRVTASCQISATNPVSAVMTLQNKKPMAMILRRLQRSAAQATGKTGGEQNNKKGDTR